jgi:hypothetical protein
MRIDGSYSTSFRSRKQNFNSTIFSTDFCIYPRRSIPLRPEEKVNGERTLFFEGANTFNVVIFVQQI